MARQSNRRRRKKARAGPAQACRSRLFQHARYSCLSRVGVSATGIAPDRQASSSSIKHWPRGRGCRNEGSDRENGSLVGDRTAETTPLMLEVQIVGIIRSERTASPGDPDPAVAYVPLAQAPSSRLKLLVAPGTAWRRYADHSKLFARSIPSCRLGMLPPCSKSATARSRAPAVRRGSSAGSLSWQSFLPQSAAWSLIQYTTAPGTQLSTALGARRGDVLSHVLRGAGYGCDGLVFGLAGVFALTKSLTRPVVRGIATRSFVLTAACYR